MPSIRRRPDGSCPRSTWSAGLDRRGRAGHPRARIGGTRPPVPMDLGVRMLGKLTRVLAGLLFGFMLFIFAAMGLAWVKRRDAVPQSPDADEVDLVATFGPL